jgi:hypothetical protein
MNVRGIIFDTVIVGGGVLLVRKLLWNDFNGEVVFSAVVGAFFASVLLRSFGLKLMGQFVGRSIANMPDIALKEDENLILQTAATYLNTIGIGGRLTLTSRRLIFQSHALNIRPVEKEIAVANVKDVRRDENKLVILKLDDGQTHKFVVDSPSRWLEAMPRS